LKEILQWSQDRPVWQRDALRRLVLSGELSDMDIIALTNICKSRHGLAEEEESCQYLKSMCPTRLPEHPYR
jgi:hypothetical protein